MILRVCLSGLPHSEIHASQDICSLAWLIAACHVLLRLREPRHSSCALLSFPFSFLGKSPLIILVFFAVSANIPSACEVLICLVDVLFCILIDLLVIIALHKCLLCLAAWLGWFAIACAFALKVTCEVLQFPTCQCSLFFV